MLNMYSVDNVRKANSSFSDNFPNTLQHVSEWINYKLCLKWKFLIKFLFPPGWRLLRLLQSDNISDSSCMRAQDQNPPGAEAEWKTDTGYLHSLAVKINIPFKFGLLMQK